MAAFRLNAAADGRRKKPPHAGGFFFGRRPVFQAFFRVMTGTSAGAKSRMGGPQVPAPAVT